MVTQINLKENNPIEVCLKIGEVEKRIIIIKHGNFATVDIYGNCDAHLNTLSYDASKVKPNQVTTTYLYDIETTITV